VDWSGRATAMRSVALLYCSQYSTHQRQLKSHDGQSTEGPLMRIHVIYDNEAGW